MLYPLSYSRIREPYFLNGDRLNNGQLIVYRRALGKCYHLVSQVDAESPQLILGAFSMH